MRYPLLAASAAATLLIPAQSAGAQSFLKRLAERAIGTAIDNAADGSSSSPTAEPAAPRAKPQPAPKTASKAPAAAPATAAAPPSPARFTDDIAKPADIESQRAAFNKFGEVSCNDCEGGIDFDGRPKFEYDARFSGQYNERAKRIGSWPIGHVHRWQGKASVGTITVRSEERIDGFRCRRVVYKLVRGADSAERPSLVCWGLANKSSSVENWHEIY